MECQWIYLVPDPQAAADAVRQLDDLPSDRIAGLGVVSKPAPSLVTSLAIIASKFLCAIFSCA